MIPLHILLFIKHRIVRFFSIITLLFIILSPGPVFPETATDLPWNVVADHFTYNKKNNTCLATGNVIVTHDQETITADSIEFNNTSKKAVAEGNVVVTSKGDRSSAQKMDLDMKAKTGILHKGVIFVETTHMYITGNEIKKTGEFTYTGDKVTITTCDGENPDWKFTGRDLSVTIEGYGKVYHAAFWAKNVPVLYSPFLIIPVKLKRQTGLLFPEFEYSDRKGFEYVQPFFWAINDSSDATFFNRFMEKRGDMFGAEYRYILSNSSKGSISFDFLNDNKTDPGSNETNPILSAEETQKYGYADSLDGRTNTKRYWFRMKQNQSLFSDSMLKVDVDQVSDQDYMREFDSMGNGYDYTNANFLENFGRGLDPKDSTIRTNSLIFTKNWSSYSFNAATYWYDDLAYSPNLSDYAKQNRGPNTTLQKLPQIDFSASRHQILASPFYYDFSSQYNYFFREANTDSTLPISSLRNGQRADLYPRLILPLKYKNWFSIETTAGFRNTNWYVENNSDSNDNLTGSHSRNIFDLSVDLSSEFFRVFNLNIGDVDKIRHTFTPELIYRYIPDQNQDDYPYFDSLDRIVRTNTATLSLKNTLTSRSVLKDGVSGGNSAATAPPKYSYNPFCRFKIEQTYDINEAQGTDPTRYINYNPLDPLNYSKEPLRPLYGEIEFLPLNYLTLKCNGSWDHYESRLLNGNIGMTLSDSRNDKLIVEHRFTREYFDSRIKDSANPYGTLISPVKYIRTYLYLKLSDRIGIFGLNEQDLQAKTELKTSAGVIFNSQCWGTEIDYTHMPGETRYTLGFSLKGLGEFGNSNNPYKTP